eukprot:7637-Heterococcus_DN1.PRE.2
MYAVKISDSYKCIHTTDAADTMMLSTADTANTALVVYATRYDNLQQTCESFTKANDDQS